MILRQLSAKPGFFPVRYGDVLAYRFQGDGFGDPIECEPAGPPPSGRGSVAGWLAKDRWDQHRCDRN